MANKVWLLPPLRTCKYLPPHSVQLWHEWWRMYPALLIPEILLAQHAPLTGYSKYSRSRRSSAFLLVSEWFDFVRNSGLLSGLEGAAPR